MDLINGIAFGRGVESSPKVQTKYEAEKRESGLGSCTPREFR